jgi:hypothetical protein
MYLRVKSYVIGIQKFKLVSPKAACVCERERERERGHDSTNRENYATFCLKIKQSYTKHLFPINKLVVPDPKLYKLLRVVTIN